MLLARGGRALALAGLLAGCPSDPESGRCDVEATTDVMLVYADQLGAVFDLVDGGVVPLITAPQGGHILLVAPAVRLPTSCELEINVALRDPATGLVIGLEERPISLHSEGGWARPIDATGLADLANVAVCPSASAPANLDGYAARLELKILDADQQPILARAAMIVPTCTSEYCRSDCMRP